MLLICFEMCTQEAKQNRIIDLLDAHTNQKKIAKFVGVIERTVQHTQHAKKLGRKTGQNHGRSYNQHKKAC